jgi:hypothetical protein
MEKPPLPIWAAARAVAKCAVNTAVLTAQRRLHLSKDHVGKSLQFADGTNSWVYRETVVDRPPTADPAVLVVGFRLRAVRGRGHALFRPLSLLNTPCLSGSPGSCRSYGWRTTPAVSIAGSMSGTDPRWPRTMRGRSGGCSLVSVPGTIHYQIAPGLQRDELLRQPGLGTQLGMHDWSRPTQVLASVG